MALPSSKWYKDLDGATKEQREAFVRSHSELLELLVTILQAEHDELLRSAQARDKFDHAGWPYEQADANGAMRAIRTILEIVDLTKD